MNYHNIPNITSQQVQIFVKAVELRNFTKVANYLNYTPSMISKTISSLEDELGIKLFIRKPHELIPTPAARMLANEWRHFLASFSSSITRARAYQKELESQIVLGFVDSSDQVDNMISSAIKSYTSSHPDIGITAEKHDMHRSAELLNSGMLDVILTSEIEVPYLEMHDLAWEKTVDTHVAVYVPHTNALFNRESIDIQDLRDQEILSLDPLMHPTYSKWMFDFCSDKGFIPNITATFRTVRSLRFSLDLMDAVFIGDSINSDWCHDNLKQFILPDRSFTLVAWRKEASSAVVEFKNYLKTIYPSEL